MDYPVRAGKFVWTSSRQSLILIIRRTVRCGSTSAVRKRMCNSSIHHILTVFALPGFRFHLILPSPFVSFVSLLAIGRSFCFADSPSTSSCFTSSEDTVRHNGLKTTKTCITDTLISRKANQSTGREIWLGPSRIWTMRRLSYTARHAETE